MIQTPQTAKDYWEDFARSSRSPTELRIMVPGDSWSSETGFSIAEQDWFENRGQHLLEYRERVADTLNKQDRLEAKVTVSTASLEKFFTKRAQEIPGLLLRPLRGREILIVAKSESNQTAVAVDLAARRVRVPSSTETFDIRIEFPALVLLQAMKLNMFGHAGISKRVKYFTTAAALPALERFNFIMELFECELLPVRKIWSTRAVKALLPRWREGLLYARAIWDRRRGLTLPELEERYLGSS